jgi:GGDEF domain-containing protein/CHASE3 domain sensor protein
MKGLEGLQFGSDSSKKFNYAMFRPSIITKITLGYFSLALLIIIISVSTFSSLKRLDEMHASIIQIDDQVIEMTEKMIDTLLQQELYARRYFILNSSEMLPVFWQKGREFDRMVEEIRAFSTDYTISVESIASVHKEFNALFLEISSLPQMQGHDERMDRKLDTLISLIKDVYTGARNSQHQKIHMTKQIVTREFLLAGILCGVGIILSISGSLMISRNISRSVNRLKHATEKISEGKFNYISDVTKEDALGGLSDAFAEMTKRLKQLEEKHIDTNPLTRLPGGSAIEKEIRLRIASGSPTAFCFVDLDDFKAFNDRYSYAAGSEVIKSTAHIIQETVSGSGTHEDFVGHIGGDDFVFITSLDRYGQLCDAVIKQFDKMIRGFYGPEDLDRGYIISRNRQGQEMQFPVMSVSIAVVTNRDGAIREYFRVGEIAADLKEYAKSLRGSICVVDRRQEKGGVSPHGDVIPFIRKSG